MQEIATDTGKYAFGVDETIKAMELGAVQTLIVWENLNCSRFTLTHPTTQEKSYVFLNPEQAKDGKYFIDKETGQKMEVEAQNILEYFAENYKQFGCNMEIVTNKSTEGAQFCKGFGGIGAILRYRYETESSYSVPEGEEGKEEERVDYDDVSDFI